jgi:Fe-S-cluster containining protein
MFLDEDNNYIKTEDDFEKAKKRLGRLKNFEINKELLENGEVKALLFKCKSLKENGQCSHYWRRSLFCRDYPAINSDFIMRGGETLDGCGFSFETDKKFEEYLK